MLTACKYFDHLNDPYKPIFNWPEKYAITDLNDLWNSFYSIWQNGDKDSLVTSIHLYIEANSNSGFLEGSIIMAQVDLELIYNWLLIEKGKLLLGKDAENISASNKIRLLIAEINIKNEIPTELKNLQSFINTESEIEDGPDALTQIRNMIIHAQEQ